MRLALAIGTPSGSPGGDCIAGQRSFALGTCAAFFPAMLEKPVLRGHVSNVAAGGETIG